MDGGFHEFSGPIDADFLLGETLLVVRGGRSLSFVAAVLKGSSQVRVKSACWVVGSEFIARRGSMPLPEAAAIATWLFDFTILRIIQ
jgi:hypothetical protein